MEVEAAVVLTRVLWITMVPALRRAARLARAGVAAGASLLRQLLHAVLFSVAIHSVFRAVGGLERVAETHTGRKIMIEPRPATKKASTPPPSPPVTRAAGKGDKPPPPSPAPKPPVVKMVKQAIRPSRTFPPAVIAAVQHERSKKKLQQMAPDLARVVWDTRLLDAQVQAPTAEELLSFYADQLDAPKPSPRAAAAAAAVTEICGPSGHPESLVGVRFMCGQDAAESVTVAEVARPQGGGVDIRFVEDPDEGLSPEELCGALLSGCLRIGIPPASTHPPFPQ
eukprot:Hpha_TRINITY_DN36629_c0_g1::TRINITY_DN36629_c0_g1_i1::g.18759::m.18759